MHAQDDGEFYLPCDMTNEAKQGVLGDNTVVYDIICTVYVCDTHFPIRNVFDGKLFNQRKLKTKTKVHIDVLDEILYADDKDKGNGEE